jgi:hypothetical protein
LQQDYQDLFSSISQLAGHDVRKAICSFNARFLEYSDLSPVEELSEIVQNYYQHFGKRMETNSIYAGNASYIIY